MFEADGTEGKGRAETDPWMRATRAVEHLREIMVNYRSRKCAPT